MDPIRCAVVGYGYWGPNLARNIAATAGAELAVLCDANPQRRGAAAAALPNTRVVDSFDAVLSDQTIDSVVLATPASSHRELGLAALQAGKHVLVEKPLAMNVADGAELVAAAEARELVLMAGHTFLYEAAVQYLSAAIARDELGDLVYIYAQRLNLGRLRNDVNAMWNLAPHDVSIVMHLIGQRPVSVAARGISALQPGIEDAVFLVIEFDQGTLAQVHVSWLDPQKVRRMVLMGSKQMAIYDDVSRDAAVTLFDKGFDAAPDDPSGFTMRNNEGTVVPLVRREPLSLECEEFFSCIRTGREPLTGGRSAIEVVRVLEGAQLSLDRRGERVLLADVGVAS